MNQDAVWSVFEKTGNIDVYLLYNKLHNDTLTLSRQEALKDADKDRRTGNQGNERR